MPSSKSEERSRGLIALTQLLDQFVK